MDDVANGQKQYGIDDESPDTPLNDSNDDQYDDYYQGERNDHVFRNI